MCAFVIHVSLVIALLIGIWHLVGDQVFMWVIIAGGPGAAAVLLFLPKRGPQYAYRNWMRANALVLILALAALFIGGLIGLASIPGVPAEGALVEVILAGLLVVLMVLALFWGYRFAPYASRRSWLRGAYPEVAAARRRYWQKGDVEEKYTPALVVDGKRLFLIYYHGRKGPDHVRGIVLLDEKGRIVRDDGLARRAARLKSLALDTIDYEAHERRARTIALSEKAMRGVSEVYEILKREKARFVERGPEAQQALDTLLASEEAVKTAISTGPQIDLLVSEWAAKHRLGRLTEVVDQEALPLFSRIDELRRPYDELFPEWSAGCRAAGVLAQEVRRMPAVPRRSMVRQGLLGLADLAEEVRSEDVKLEYWGMPEEHWSSWRERMAYAEELDAGRAGKGQR